MTVTMRLDKIDIQQCPEEYHVPNAFKASDKCDRGTSYCVPIQGRWFETGGYKCECLQGYEYPFEDSITYFDGQLVEAEFLSMVNNNKTKYDMLKCRLASASLSTSSLFLVATLTSLLTLLSYSYFT